MSQLITKRIQDSDNSLNSAKNEAIRNISIPVRDLVAITTKKLSGIEPKSENIETVVDKIIRNYGL